MLPADVWRGRARAHAERADALLAGHRQRAERGLAHPVQDFLFTYYSLRPSALRRWHPGVGVRLADAAERRSWRWYVEEAGGCLGVDLPAYRSDRGDLVRVVAALLSTTAARPPRLGCFGLHEWAIVHRQPAGDVRHASWGLRLGSARTDEVVESLALQCTHYDAFRFFAPSARPRNATQPTRAGQVGSEQPGCLHATMDLYKWAYQLGPTVPGELLLDCFELARDARSLDMRASPYDLSALGYEPVPVETAAGRAAYVAEQRALVARAAPLRERLLAVCEAVLGPERSAEGSPGAQRAPVVAG